MRGRGRAAAAAPARGGRGVAKAAPPPTRGRGAAVARGSKTNVAAPVKCEKSKEPVKVEESKVSCVLSDFLPIKVLLSSNLF